MEFIDWLPDLGVNEKFYLSLFARKKYEPGLIKSNDKTQLKRFVSCKKRMVDKIRQLEVELGRWKLGDTEATQDSLVLYINPNPRCMKKATRLSIKALVDLLDQDGFNVHQEVMSCIQKSKSYSFVVDFDIDSKDIDLSLIELPLDQYKVLETRGGYHILVHPRNNQFYKYIQALYNVDQAGDQMLPVPGCIQGGFIPKFV